MKNNEKRELDDQIRAALDNFAQQYNQQHWHTMNERLDALDAADASFDTALRGRLADISVVPTADAWSKMSEKLDNLDAADSSFDNALRGRLAEVTVASTMGDWSKMSEKLDSFEDAESDFDEVLRRKLENIAGKHPNHWAMMNERLDREFTLKGKIFKYKIIEAALMLLAFFTVLNVIDHNTEGVDERGSQNSEMPANATTQGETLNNQTSNNTAPTVGMPQKNATNPQINTRLQPTINSTKSFDKSSNWRLRGGLQIEQNSNQNGQNAQPSQPILTPTGQPIVENTLKNGQNTEGGYFGDKALQNGSLPNFESVKSNELPVVAVDNSARNSVVDVIAPINTLQANLLNNNGLDVPITIIKPNLDKKGKWRLSAFGTAALDWVTTSFVYKREQHFQNQGVPNAGINALVSYQRGKVEVETGLMVNQKKYSIGNAKSVVGSFFRSYEVNDPDKIRLSIVSIPLNVNVRLKESRRWKVYAHGGIAVNAVVDALDYRLKSKTADTTTVGGAPQIDPTPPSEVVLASYSKGLMNGGETRENTFWTGHVGVGVEYKLSPKTSLFLQPTASFMLENRGIGSLNDRISSYSIQGGAKLRL